MDVNKCYCGDALATLRTFPSQSVDCCVTSPPYYGLRDYGIDGQIGLEETPELYIKRVADIFDEVKRVLRDDGTLWLNIGDSYSGSGKGAALNPENAKQYKQGTNKGTLSKKTAVHYISDEIRPKNLIGIPWMLAFELRRRGWYLRQDIIWAKPNPMPESVKDRCTKSHEYIFLLSKSANYYFDAEAIAEPVVNSTLQRSNQEVLGRYGGKKNTENPDMFFRTKSGSMYKFRPKRNKRDVWTVSTTAYKGSHFATFPEDLVAPCILAGCPKDGIVLDPFFGSGTVGVVCRRKQRNFVGIEINPEYINLSNERVSNVQMDLLVN